MSSSTCETRHSGNNESPAPIPSSYQFTGGSIDACNNDEKTFTSMEHTFRTLTVLFKMYKDELRTAAKNTSECS